MPEGDTIFRAARTLQRALAGATVTRFESMFPALNRIDADRPLAGRTVESVTAQGKHMLMAFSGDLVLRTHMRMHGSWHLYRPGERWQRPVRDMRIVVETSTFVAVGFNVPIAEFLTSRDIARHRQLGTLGPDLLAADFDHATAASRLRAHNADTIADALLNQRLLAGIGNVFKSEILFLAGLHPHQKVGALSDEALKQLIVEARRQLQANVLNHAQTLSPAVGRRTTRSLDPAAKLWVYGRAGQPCRRCGALIRGEKSGPEARNTYWCPRCQPAPV
jgi:endonuclease VIII